MKLIKTDAGTYVNAEYLEHFYVDDEHERSIRVSAYSTHEHIVGSGAYSSDGEIVEYVLYYVKCTDETREAAIAECEAWLDKLVKALNVDVIAI